MRDQRLYRSLPANGESVLVDAPAEAALIQEQLQGTIRSILMTHGHFDHTGALAD